ncbi:MAG TPA: S8 family peptidase [Herpetosiphonaceae bacterium]
MSGVVLTASMALNNPAAAAPAKLVPAQGKAIPNQYIVVLKDGPSINAGSVAQSIGVSPKHTYESVLNGFAATLNAGQLKALQKHPNVAYIEQDSEVSIQTTQPVSGGQWGLDRIDQRNLPLNGAYNYNATAANVTAYIIDTGIYPSHTNFGGRAAVAYDALGGNGIDCNGHGTFLAGVIGSTTYGVAKNVRLRGVRVLNCQGSGAFADVIEGLDWVRLNAVKPAVVNLAVGGGLNTSYNTAINNLYNSGVFIAAVAGSSNANACNYSPASAAGAYAVAASTTTDAKASFTNYGSCVDIYAPGMNITSTWIGSTTATNTISGTASATAHVTGVAALVLSVNPGYTQSQVTSWLNTNATPNVISGNPAGTPNRLLYKSTL